MKKVAFITGATSGFGSELARILNANGYLIVALGRRKDRLDELVKDLDGIYPIQCDIRDKNKLFKSVENLPSEYKNISVLVNNAGLALGQDSVCDASLEDFEVMVDTNIKGILYSTKAVLPFIKKTKGYIFNIGSVAGRWPYDGANVYGATKSFVSQFSLNLRNDLKGSGVRVTDISPGLAKTEFSEVRFKQDKQKAESVYNGIKYLKANDIALIVLSCLNLPEHVNVNNLEVMPTSQTWAGFYFDKN